MELPLVIHASAVAGRTFRRKIRGHIHITAGAVGTKPHKQSVDLKCTGPYSDISLDGSPTTKLLQWRSSTDP